MSNADEYATYYLELMRQGQAEEAFFGLIDGPAEVLPVLIDAFHQDENRGIRPGIVQCIWQRGRPETIGFLAEVLHDPEPTVWQEALDGLVSIGGCEAVRALEAGRTRIPVGQAGRAITVEWIDEALEQVKEQLTEEL